MRAHPLDMYIYEMYILAHNARDPTTLTKSNMSNTRHSKKALNDHSHTETTSSNLSSLTVSLSEASLFDALCKMHMWIWGLCAENENLDSFWNATVLRFIDISYY